MTGWRLGYGAMPVEFAEVISKLMVNSNSCTSMAVQRAGVEALTGPKTMWGNGRGIPRAGAISWSTV